MTQKSHELIVTAEHVRGMLKNIAKYPRELFLSEICRRFLAIERWKSSGRNLRIHERPNEGVMPGTIHHNRQELERDLFHSAKRTKRLINPLSSLEPVYSYPHLLKVLSIGPRTEMELLHLVGIGFEPGNITAIDLISSSPLIDVGDMHDLPYPDKSFDVILSGWAIAYSNRPQRAVDEMIRVCKSGGLIGIGCTNDPSFDRSRVGVAQSAEDIAGSMYAHASELVSLMGCHVDQVCFQDQPMSPLEKGAVMIIARILHSES